jgi:hypothetical protein
MGWWVQNEGVLNLSRRSDSREVVVERRQGYSTATPRDASFSTSGLLLDADLTALQLCVL